MSDYSEKLKDPRWQKKRLEILEKRNWCCESCYDDKSTLNVHHKNYRSNAEPWDYDDELLIVLCDDCHKKEHEDIDDSLHDLCGFVKDKFISPQIFSLCTAFRHIKLVHTGDVIASAIEDLFSSEVKMEKLVDEYFEGLNGHGG